MISGRRARCMETGLDESLVKSSQAMPALEGIIDQMLGMPVETEPGGGKGWLIDRLPTTVPSN